MSLKVWKWANHQCSTPVCSWKISLDNRLVGIFPRINVKEFEAASSCSLTHCDTYVQGRRHNSTLFQIHFSFFFFRISVFAHLPVYFFFFSRFEILHCVNYLALMEPVITQGRITVFLFLFYFFFNSDS